MLDLVLWRAVEGREPLELIYLDKKGRFSQRRVQVLSLDRNRLHVFCHRRRQFRTLDRHGILAAFPVERGAGGQKQRRA